MGNCSQSQQEVPQLRTELASPAQLQETTGQCPHCSSASNRPINFRQYHPPTRMGACVSKKETAPMPRQRKRRNSTAHSTIQTNEKRPYNIKTRFIDSVEEEWHCADHVDAKHSVDIPVPQDILVDIDHGSAPRVPAGKAYVNKNAHQQRRRSAAANTTSRSWSVPVLHNLSPNIPSPGSPTNANLERVNTTELSPTEETLLWQEFCKYQAMFAKCDKVFETLDANGDGILTRAEVIKGLKSSSDVRGLLGLDFKREDINLRPGNQFQQAFEQVFQNMDADSDKKITRKEFTEYLSGIHAPVHRLRRNSAPDL